MPGNFLFNAIPVSWPGSVRSLPSTRVDKVHTSTDGEYACFAISCTSSDTGGARIYANVSLSKRILEEQGVCQHKRVLIAGVHIFARSACWGHNYDFVNSSNTPAATGPTSSTASPQPRPAEDAIKPTSSGKKLAIGEMMEVTDSTTPDLPGCVA